MNKHSVNKDNTSYEELQEEAFNREPGLPYVGTKDEAPDWITTGYYLETGWRINFNSWGKAFRSLFMLHNETVNVWSHLCGALFFLFMIIYIPIKMGTPD